MQLTYDALRIIGFDTALMKGMADEMSFMRDLAHARQDRARAVRGPHADLVRRRFRPLLAGSPAEVWIKDIPQRIEFCPSLGTRIACLVTVTDACDGTLTGRDV